MDRTAVRLITMNKQRKILIGWLAAGLLGAVGVRAEVAPGFSADEVVQELGAPEQMIQINDRQIWYYDRGRVDLVEGEVVEAVLVSEEEAIARRERMEWERLEREQAQRELREARLVKGLTIQEEKLGDAGFLAQPAATRLAFWRSFKRSNPEVPLSEDYYAALEEREDELQQREAENRLAKALWELGELSAAREHYQTALALDSTNRIAERNIDRLKMLMVAAGEKTVPAVEGSKAPVSIFVEETGKTGFAFLTDLADPRELAQVNPGDYVELTPNGGRLIATSNGLRIGIVEPRVAARLLKLIADGNKYAAGVTSLGDKDVRIIIREVFQDPSNYGKVSFPTAAKSTDLRPYTKGTLVREEMELEDDLDDDDEDDEIEDLDRALPPDSTTDEAFEEETDDLDEA